MEKLNSSQEEAVTKSEGRILVLAGAGSGKTRVIIHRILHLLSKGTDPKQILGLTFTNKAAEEMRMRLQSKVGKEVATEVTLSTFHSFCMKILRKEIHHLGYTNEFSLYDDRDEKRLAEEVEFDEVRLKACMRAHNAVTFDGLIQLTIQLFQEFPGILEKVQDRFRYLMIDEYQDTNHSQFLLAELLSSKYNNICVVGDDDQSIYGWRGAEVKNILHFRADHTIKLQENYRSTSTILQAANCLIKKNKNRHPKTLISYLGEGERIEIFHAANEIEEATAIVTKVLEYAEKMPLNEIAILYRSNALSRNLESALLQATYRKDGSWKRGLPYEIYGGLAFAERSEIKDLSAYLRLIANPLDQQALLRIINVPARGISEKTLDTVTAYNRQKNLPLWNLLENLEVTVTDRAKAAIGNFVQLIHRAKRRFASQKLYEALQWLIQEIDYEKVIQNEATTDKGQLFKRDNIQEFISNLAQYEEGAQNPSLQDFTSGYLLESTKAKKGGQDKNKLQLMTFHSAKGLEFTVCFLIGLEDGIVPHEKGMQETSLEEERRLFYVAMTRAKRKLILSMARQRKKWGKDAPCTPSRFLLEIPKNLLIS